MDTLTSLASFRAAAYATFSRRQDALLELCDTLLTTGPVPSLPLLSVQPQHRRRWGSLSDALAVGEISPSRLEKLLVSSPLAGGEPIYAVDVSVWPRCDAETSPERAIYYQASRPRAIRGDNPSSLAGRIRGLRTSVSPARAGRRRCAYGGCARKRMPMCSPPSRSWPSSPTCPRTVPCRGSSSMPATIPSS